MTHPALPYCLAKPAGLPFDDESVPRLLSKVKRGQFVIPAWVTPDAQDLIKR